MNVEAPGGTDRARGDRDDLRRRIAQLEAALEERSRQVSALEERVARLQRTFDLAGVGIAHVSLDGRFLCVNRRVTEILARADIASGRLVPVLSDVHASDPEPILALHPGGKLTPQKTRAFIEYFRHSLKGFAL